MRILHLDAGREMRGGQWQVLRLIEGLNQAGVESMLLAREDAPLFAAARERAWRVQPLSPLRAWLNARRHDVVHAHDSHSHTTAALLPGVPLIVSRRVGFNGAGLWPALSAWKYRRPARFIAISEFVKSVLVQRGIPAEKVTVVYDGVPLLPMTAQAQGLPHLDKGTGLAAEAAKLAGVTLYPAANLEKDLQNAALLLYLTDSEGLGSGALMAMAAGVPVIASNIGGLPEAIRDGETGLLVPNRAPPIAAALRKLLDNPELARRIGAAGRQSIVERFTVDRMVRNTMEVYRDVLRAGQEAYPI